MTLKQAWNSKKYKRLRQMHKDGSWINYKICYECMMPGQKFEDREKIPLKNIT